MSKKIRKKQPKLPTKKMVQYAIPVNEAARDENGEPTGSVTVEILTLPQAKKGRVKAWRRYCALRLNSDSSILADKVAKEMGFKELVG